MRVLPALITRSEFPHWLLVLLVTAWILPGLIGHDPWKPDEAYSFGLVYHILQTGDWVVPTLAGEPFMEKPPLFYVTAALTAKLFSAWLPLHDGARLASGFYLALTLLFIALAANEIHGRGRETVLTLLACLGLAPLAHLLLTDTALLAGLALGLYGFALGLRSPLAGGIWLGTGAGVAFLSKGLIGPGLLGLTALLLPLLHYGWRTRAYLHCLAAAAMAALPWLLVWPLALYLRAPELFSAWFWDNNFGRFLGSSRLGPQQEAFFYLRTLTWFAWPAWLLALWALWSGGNERLRQPGTLLPLALLSVTLLALMGAADARQVYALPLLLPLALLAAPAAELFPRWASILLQTLGVVVALAVLVLVWGVWSALKYGFPAILVEYLGNPPQVTAPAVGAFAAVMAFGYSVCGLTALYLARRLRERVLVTWAIGMTLFLGLSMTLLLGAVDAQKSYRGAFTALKAAIPATYRCVASEGLGEPQRAMLEYFAGIRTLRRAVHPRADCDLLLRQEYADEPVSLDARAWRLLWEGGRPGDTKERFRLFQRL